MTSESRSTAGQFFEELKRRRVMRVATLYVIVLWPVIQIVDILGPAIDLPDSTMRYLLIAFVAGLPLALALSWLFDLNRSGIVRANAPGEQGQALLGRGTELTIIVLLLGVIGVLFYLQLSRDEATPAAPAPAVAAAPDQHSIAVLPFVAFSQAPEDQHFSDGLTEELLNVLSQIRYLRVTARTTSFAYKGVSRNVQEIGAELNVATILEGSVRRNDTGNTIRVTAQLIDTSDGAHLWSGSFDREFRDVFRIQDEIAAAVVDQLNIALGADDTRRLAGRESLSPEAMVAFGMGRTALATRTSQSLRDAQRYFEQAIAADPSYAAAHAELANASALLAELEPGRRAALLEEARGHVGRALELAPDSGSAWAAQGLLLMVLAEDDPTRYPEAKKALHQAIELNPNLAMANMWYGNLQEDLSEQRRYYETAFALDPRSPVAGYNLANNLLQDGQEAEAMEIFSRIVEADPEYPGAYRLIAEINEGRGRLGEAIRNYGKVYDMQPSSRVALDIAALWVDIGDTEQADLWLERAAALAGPDEREALRWMGVGSEVAAGNRPAAEARMRELLASENESFATYLSAAQAGYFLFEYAAATDAFERALTLAPDVPWTQDTRGIEVQLAAAYSYAQQGNAEQASALLAEVAEAFRRKDEAGRRLTPEHYYLRAQLHAQQGDPNLALLDLQRAVDEGWRQHWRPKVEPSLESLTELPAFDAMMAGLATRMDLIREQIAFSESFEAGWEI